ncbi:hypothetical protein C8R46DRAFT_1071659, partial [Mycena filopes]
MRDITIISANLAALVFDTFLYGLFVLLFILTVYFLAARRTLAGTRYTTRHHFTSLAFIGVAILFLVVTVHWVIVVYQAFHTFIQLGTTAAGNAFYGDLGQMSEVIKAIVLFLALLLGDALVTYRLWVIWGRSRIVVVFPVLALGVVAISAVAMTSQLTRRRTSLNDSWMTTLFVLSLLANVYSTGLIIFRILGHWQGQSKSDSRLMAFLVYLAESAALQTLWLIITAATGLAGGNIVFIPADTFPAIIGISNTLIHARVGLGWSPSSESTPDSMNKVPSPAARHVV